MLLRRKKPNTTGMAMNILTGLHSCFPAGYPALHNLLHSASFKIGVNDSAGSFSALAVSLLLSTRQLRNITITLFLSGLLFGINLADANRGSGYSRLAIVKTISGQDVRF